MLIIILSIGGLVYVNQNNLDSGFPVPADNKVSYGVQLDWETDSIKDYSQRLGKTPKVFGVYTAYPLNDDLKNLINANLSELVAHKSSIMLTLEPWEGLDSVNEDSLADLTTTLQSWNDKGLSVLVRFAHEMNGAWYPWAQQPTEYIATFRKVAAAVHVTSQSGMLWSPNEAGGYPYVGGEYEIKPTDTDYRLLDTNRDGTINMLDDPYSPYYPGDDAVDWVGLSIYHFGQAWPWGLNTVPDDGKLIAKINGEFRNNATDESTLPNFYKEYSEVRNKPFAISETSALFIDRPDNGAANLEVKNAWIDQVYSESLVSIYPNLRMVVWFEFEKEERDTAPSPVDWNVTNNPDILRHLQESLPEHIEFARDY